MAVVLAGGQGTRLYPLTQTRCKPSMAFGSRYRLIDVPISNSLNSGIRHIAVISQYFASELNQHISSTFRLDQFQQGSFDLLTPEETPNKKVWFQGTADAVRQTLEHLLASPAEYFLILSGDQLYTIDFRPLLEFTKEKKADLVILSLPVYEKEAKRMGLLKIDNQHRVIDFFEKPSDPGHLEKFIHRESPKHPPSDPRYLGSMGIYVFKRSALVSILQEKGDDFGRNIIPLQVQRGATYSYVYEGYWEDIGTIASYYYANLALTKRDTLLKTHECLDLYNEKCPIYSEPLHLPGSRVTKTRVEQSILGQGSVIYADEIFQSIVGLRAYIGHGTVLRESIVLGGYSAVSIGDHCHIEKTIVDEGAHIGNNVRLINKGKLITYDGDGVFVRDGVIIVANGTHLPDGFTL